MLAGVVLLSVAGAGRKYVAGGWVPLLMESVERERAVGLNPLDPTTTLQFGESGSLPSLVERELMTCGADENVMVDDFEPIVRVGELATITFHCEHPDVALCAPAYRVFLSGPTLVSPLYSRSSERMDERHVRVSFELRDAGQYEMYAFAEHATCAEWTEGEAVPCELSCERSGAAGGGADSARSSVHKLAVKGTPMQLTVEGSGELARSPFRLGSLRFGLQHHGKASRRARARCPQVAGSPRRTSTPSILLPSLAITTGSKLTCVLAFPPVFFALTDPKL